MVLWYWNHCLNKQNLFGKAIELQTSDTMPSPSSVPYILGAEDTQLIHQKFRIRKTAHSLSKQKSSDHSMIIVASEADAAECCPEWCRNGETKCFESKENHVEHLGQRTPVTTTVAERCWKPKLLTGGKTWSFRMLCACENLEMAEGHSSWTDQFITGQKINWHHPIPFDRKLTRELLQRPQESCWGKKLIHTTYNSMYSIQHATYNIQCTIKNKHYTSIHSFMPTYVPTHHY